MLENILGAVTGNSGILVGGGASAIVLWVLKRYQTKVFAV